MVSASDSAARPNTITLATPKSRAKVAICEVTIRPEVDIMVIIANINQNSGVRSIWRGARSCVLAAMAGAGMAAAWLASGERRACEAMTPITANTRPNCQSVVSNPALASEAEIGKVVRIAPMP